MAIKKENIIEILIDWNLWGNFSPNFKPREEYLKKINSFLKTGQILVIKGVRRAGKSALTYLTVMDLIKKGHLKKENALFINFEDPRLPIDLEIKDIIKIYETYLEDLRPTGQMLVVLDEIQRVKAWERAARFFLENKNLKVIVTGSSSKLLSQEYATVLTGRHIDLEIFPLSFQEFLQFKNLKLRSKLDILRERVKIKQMLTRFVNYGGFPKVILEKEKEKLLETYFNDIIVKDVVQRFKIKEMGKLTELARWYVTNISTVQSFNKIKNYFKLSLDSVERFSSYFDLARLCIFVPKFSYSPKSLALSPKKVYIIDQGFFKVLGFNFSQNLGRIYENIVGLEILRFYKKEIFYWKNSGHEVDFVVKEGLKITRLIQVCYNIENPEVKKREIQALLRASQELSCRDLLVITEDYQAEEKVIWRKMSSMIKFIPLWKWLLNN